MAVSNKRVRSKGWAQLNTDLNNRKALTYELDQDDMANTAREVFGSVQGGEVLKYLDHYVYSPPSFNFNSENCALEAAYTAGMREVVERIHYLIRERDNG